MYEKTRKILRNHDFIIMDGGITTFDRIRIFNNDILGISRNFIYRH